MWSSVFVQCSLQASTRVSSVKRGQLLKIPSKPKRPPVSVLCESRAAVVTSLFVHTIQCKGKPDQSNGPRSPVRCLWKCSVPMLLRTITCYHTHIIKFLPKTRQLKIGLWYHLGEFFILVNKTTCHGFLQQIYKGGITSPILQMGKLRPRDKKWSAQGHIAGKSRISWILVQGIIYSATQHHLHVFL